MPDRRLTSAALLVAAALLLTGCSAGGTVTASCDASMEVAAGVVDLNNDVELLATAEACRDTNDWVAGIQANPGAGSLTSYTRLDAIALLRLVCTEAPGSRVCVDAATKGELTE